MLPWPDPAISIVISTYNRGALLRDAVRSVLAQQGVPAYEVIVVDNNSTDDTRAVVSALARNDARVRYVFEGRQGVAHGRNAGVAASRANIVAFTDDDIRATPQWIASILRAFEEQPTADYVGGRILPMWPGEPPAWLTVAHWSPLAIVDYGSEPLVITPDRWRCILTANMAVKRAAFEAVGGFNPAHQHLPGAVSAIEDHELQLRLLGSGYEGWYVPTIETMAEVQANRLTASYHLRWWYDHGKAVARMTPPGYAFDGGGTMRRTKPNAKRVMGVPLYLVRGALRDFRRATWELARRNQEHLLFHLTRGYEQIGSAYYHATTRAKGHDAGVHTGPPSDRLVTS